MSTCQLMSHWTCTYKEGTLSKTTTKIRTVICYWRQIGLLCVQKSATHLIFTYTRNSAIADKPCDAFRDINLRQILWPWNHGWGSLKFIGNITIRYSACVFLLTFCSICGYLVSFLRYAMLKNVMTLKSGPEVTQGHRKWYHLIDCVVSYL